MRVQRDLIFILCLSAFIWAINAKAEECNSHLSKTAKLYGMLGRSDSYTVELVASNFTRHFLNGTPIKIEEVEYVLHYLFNKDALASEEAYLGLKLVEEYVMLSTGPDISSSEVVLTSLIKFRLRLYEIKEESFERHLKDANVMVDEYIRLYPDSEKAHYYFKKVKRLLATFPSNT